MAPIDSLPPELIRHTFHLGASSLSSFSIEERDTFLQNAALVRRSWREHTQAELWDFVALGNTPQLCSFLISQLEVQRTTRRLAFCRLPPDSICWNGLHVSGVLAASSGVRNFEINDVYAFRPEYLCQPSLEVLQSLQLRKIFRLPKDYESYAPKTIDFPFLPLAPHHSPLLPLDPSTPSIVGVLLPQAALTSLRLVCITGGRSEEEVKETWDHLSPLLISLAPQLSHLELVPAPGYHEGLERLDPFLETLVNLRHLTTSTSYLAALDHIPAKLEGWTVKTDSEAGAKEVLLPVIERAASLSELRRLRIELVEVESEADGSEDADEYEEQQENTSRRRMSMSRGTRGFWSRGCQGERGELRCRALS